MGLARSLGVALTGTEGELVEIEVDISAGLPGTFFTGRADPTVVEARDRLRAAAHNCRIDWPDSRITVGLLPADVRKTGSRFDLAIGVAVLAAAGRIPAEPVARTAWMAEVGLDGALRPVRGVLPAIVAARRHGVSRVVVARANGREAALVTGVEVRVADDLSGVVDWLTADGPELEVLDATALTVSATVTAAPDLCEVAGQSAAKRALEIAAAGCHHLYMVGPPGAGKTMLAERLPGLLPRLTESQALEVTAVHSIAGLLRRDAQLVQRPPIQAPHHTASLAALVGGGSFLARPGAISLAHHGVLFLDEAAEFAPNVLDALREPLETGHVLLHRGGGAVLYPARFQLVLAANPCGCVQPQGTCTCSPQAKRRHRQRLSGPLMDRIDLRMQIEAVTHDELFGSPAERETSDLVAARVAAARESAASRWAALGYRFNAEVPGAVLRTTRWLPPAEVIAPASRFLERGALTARGFDRLLRTSWTIADLNGHERPSASDVAEALFYRIGQVETWAA